MKKTLICALIFCAAFTTQAQKQLKFKDLKDSAIHYFCLAQKTGNSHASMEELERVLDIYDHYCILCLAHFKTQKEKDAFLKMVTASCPEYGKL